MAIKPTRLECEKFVRICYELILDRTPTKTEMKWWIDSMMRGASENDIIYGFVSSSEFLNKRKKKVK